MNHFSIQVKRLHKRFGKRTVLRNITFIHKKGILGIAGSNGSGKSTLMKCLAGLCGPTKGKVHWEADGTAIGFADFKKYIGYAAPYINLYDELTCFENLRFILEMRDAAEKENRIENVLTETGMISFSSQLFRDLSTGQRQRMRIASALVHQPQILFLDEPGSNLDEQGHTMIQKITATFKKAEKPVIIASNDRRELRLCDQIYSVESGRFRDE